MERVMGGRLESALCQQYKAIVLITTSFALSILGMNAAHATTDIDIFHRAEEKRTETTSYCVSGTWSTHSDQHVLKVHIRRWATDTSDADHEYITLSDVYIPQECEGSPVDSGHSPEYVDGGSTESGYHFNLALHFTNPPSGNSHDYVAVDLPIASTLTYGYVAVRYRIRAIVKDVHTLAVISDTTSNTLHKLKIDRVNASKDASVDERVGYPDDGNSTDPNSGSGFLNFGSSIYKGGIFAGKFAANNDHSGESRIQLGFTMPGDGYLFATLSMMYLGCPSNGSGTLVLGVFIPSSPGSWSEGTVKWDTKFDVQPRSDHGSYSWDMSKDPLSTVSFPMTGSTYPQFEYANWTLQRYDEPTYPVPESYANVCIAALDPASPTWAYFSDKEYAALYDADSSAEASKKASAPHLWAVSVVEP